MNQNTFHLFCPKVFISAPRSEWSNCDFSGGYTFATLTDLNVYLAGQISLKQSTSLIVTVYDYNLILDCHLLEK